MDPAVNAVARTVAEREEQRTWGGDDELHLVVHVVEWFMCPPRLRGAPRCRRGRRCIPQIS